MTSVIAGRRSIQYTTSNSGRATRRRTTRSPYALAEAGLANGAAVLAEAVEQRAERRATAGCGAGRQQRRAQLHPRLRGRNRGTGACSIRATSGRSTRSASSTTRLDVGGRREVTSTIHIMPALTQPLNNDAWNYMYSPRTPRAGVRRHVSRTRSRSTSPLFVLGDLCFAQLVRDRQGPRRRVTSTIYVGQHVIRRHRLDRVELEPDQRGAIAGGCRAAASRQHRRRTGHPCTNATHVRRHDHEQRPRRFAAADCQLRVLVREREARDRPRLLDLVQPHATSRLRDSGSTRNGSAADVQPDPGNAATPASVPERRVKPDAVVGELSWNARPRC